MACGGCAKRMGKHFLPATGYERDPLRHGWIHEATGDFIADKDIEEHHTREAARIIGLRVKSFFTQLETP